MNTENTEIFTFILNRLETLHNSENIERMKRFGISIEGNAFGAPVSVLRKIAKPYKNNQALAVKLWDAGYHETRMLASLIADPEQFTPELMDEWVLEFSSWDICDACCFNLFRYLSFANEKIYQYAQSEQEFVRRTAFSLIAGLCFKAKGVPDSQFIAYLDLIEQYSTDSQNFVKKAVNWALRQIGKRNRNLFKFAYERAYCLSLSENKTCSWIGKDALREFDNPKIQRRIKYV